MTADDLIRLIEIRTSPKLRSLQKRIESGTATLRDSFEYSAAVAGIAGRVLSENIIGITPEERELICTALLRQNHRVVNDIFAQVQENIDRRNGLTLRPRQGEFPAERVQQFAHSLVDPTVEESVIRRRARSGTENITLSFHDDSVRENAKFRNDAGLTCYLDRQTNGKCCPWCSDAAGRYLYGTEPRDIYRRHDNCNCTVIFENGRQRQNVWTKRSWEAPEVGSGNKPKVFSEDEARSIEQRNLSQIRGISVDNSGGSGIIESRKTQFIPAKTISEAEEYGRRFADTVNYSGLSLDNVNIINETLTELHELYPTKQLERIISNSQLKVSSARSSCASLSINPLIGTLGKPPDELRKEIVNSLKIWKTARENAPASLQKKYDKVIKQLEERLKFDRWSESSGIDTKKTIIHEYGHIIADQYFGQINNKLANPNCYSEEGIKLRKLVNEAYRKAKSTGDIYKISEYASSDDQEFFAETFAMYHLGEELPEYIRDMVKGVLEHGAV